MSPSTPLRYAQDRLRDEAISYESRRKDKDCFAALAMTRQPFSFIVVNWIFADN
jgi:hypothetical protein